MAGPVSGPITSQATASRGPSEGPEAAAFSPDTQAAIDSVEAARAQLQRVIDRRPRGKTEGEIGAREQEIRATIRRLDAELSALRYQAGVSLQAVQDWREEIRLAYVGLASARRASELPLGPEHPALVPIKPGDLGVNPADLGL